MLTESETKKILNCVMPENVIKAVGEIRRCRMDEEFKLMDVDEDLDSMILKHTSCPPMKQRGIMENAGLSYVGSGMYRNVWSWDDCVVKVAKTQYTKIANQDEYDMWNYGPDSIKNLLVPVSDNIGDGEAISMPKVEKTSSNERPSYMAVDDLQSELDARGYTCYDLHKGNVGFMDGKPKIMDYDGNLWSCVLQDMVKKSPEFIEAKQKAEQAKREKDDAFMRRIMKAHKER